MFLEFYQLTSSAPNGHHLLHEKQISHPAQFDHPSAGLGAVGIILRLRAISANLVSADYDCRAAFGHLRRRPGAAIRSRNPASPPLRQPRRHCVLYLHPDLHRRGRAGSDSDELDLDRPRAQRRDGLHFNRHGQISSPGFRSFLPGERFRPHAVCGTDRDSLHGRTGVGFAGLGDNLRGNGCGNRADDSARQPAAGGHAHGLAIDPRKVFVALTRACSLAGFRLPAVTHVIVSP